MTDVTSTEDLARARDGLVPAVGARLERRIGDGVEPAVMSARYMSASAGTGLRLEPELEVGITLRP